MHLTPEQSALATTFYGIAINTANRYRFIPGVDFDDLKSACHEAVCRAVVKYDEACGKSMKSFVIDYCRYSCLDTINEARRRPNLVAESAPPAIVDRPFPSLAKGVTDFPAYHNSTPRCREIIDTYLVEGNCRKVAKKLGVSHQYIGQEITKFIQSAKGDLCEC